MLEGDAAAAANANASAAGNRPRSPTSALPGATTAATTTTSSATAKKEGGEGLFRRLGELFKAGCGSGVLAESTSRTSGEGMSHTKICLSLDSGLDLLLRAEPEQQQQQKGGDSDAEGGGDGEGEGDDEEDENEDFHYDLLLRPQDMRRLVGNSGKIGIVTIPQTVGELTGLDDAGLLRQALERSRSKASMLLQDNNNNNNDSDDEGETSGSGTDTASAASASDRRKSKRKSKVKKKQQRASQSGGHDTSTSAGATVKKASSLARVGMEARSFEVAVARGRWTHIALVATAVPNNRLTLYMVS